MSSKSPAAFDAYAGNYERAVQRGVGLSGEDSAYFAEGRVAWVARRLAELGLRVGQVLDFGCGPGSTAPLLLAGLGADRVVGTDASEALLEVARRDHGSARVRFVSLEERPRGEIDLAYCNGVFHHIPVSERDRAVGQVLNALRPSGLFAFWENNPWNPGTRAVMRRIPFDRNAVMLSPREARRLLVRGGFAPLRTDFLFVFPRPLAPLRRVEPAMARIPAGAQYLVLARKP